jgi:hypothetical protein
MLEISKMKTLTLLALDGINVSPSSWKYLQNLPHLKKLSVREVKLTDEALKHICGIPTLTELQLDGNTNLTIEGYSELLQLKHLTLVAFRELKVTNKFVDILVKMPKLERLYLNLTNVTDDQLKLLSASKTLAEIELENDSNISMAGVAQLFSLPQFRSIDLRNDEWLKDSDFTSLKLCKRPFRLSVEKTHITDVAMKTVAQTKCSSIDISKTEVTDRGLLELAKLNSLNYIRYTPSPELITERGIKKFRAMRPDVELKADTSGAGVLNGKSGPI